MEFDFSFEVQIYEMGAGKWCVELVNSPVRAFGTTKLEAYTQFIAVYELYREYGESWMTDVVADRNEGVVNEEMVGNPWSPDRDAWNE